MSHNSCGDIHFFRGLWVPYDTRITIEGIEEAQQTKALLQVEEVSTLVIQSFTLSWSCYSNSTLQTSQKWEEFQVRPLVDVTNALGMSFVWISTFLTVIITLSTVAFLSMSFMVPRRNCLADYTMAFITLISAIAYFSMASNLRCAPIFINFTRTNLSDANREIFYVRCIY